MLCAVFKFFQTGSMRTISFVPCPQCGASSCNSEELAHCFNERSPIPSWLAQFSLELWRVYTDSDPAGFSQLMDRLGHGHAMQTVIRYVIAEYPSVTNGLSRTEEALLRSARQPDSILRIVGRTIGNSDDTIGDIPLYEKVREFLIAKIPTLKLSDETHVVERGSLENFS